MCASGLGMRVCVRALSQELYITFVHQTRIKRSVRPWLSLHREQVRGAWGGGRAHPRSDAGVHIPQGPVGSRSAAGIDRSAVRAGAQRAPPARPSIVHRSVCSCAAGLALDHRVYHTLSGTVIQARAHLTDRPRGSSQSQCVINAPVQKCVIILIWFDYISNRFSTKTACRACRQSVSRGPLTARGSRASGS